MRSETPDRVALRGETPDRVALRGETQGRYEGPNLLRNIAALHPVEGVEGRPASKALGLLMFPSTPSTSRINCRTVKSCQTTFHSKSTNFLENLFLKFQYDKCCRRGKNAILAGNTSGGRQLRIKEGEQI